MKKIIIAAAVVLVSSIVALSTRMGNMKPSIVGFKITFYDHQKDLASAD